MDGDQILFADRDGHPRFGIEVVEYVAGRAVESFDQSCQRLETMFPKTPLELTNIDVTIAWDFRYIWKVPVICLVAEIPDLFDTGSIYITLQDTHHDSEASGAGQFIESL